MNRRSLFGLALATPALAQSDKPIRLIVPVAPGGSQDLVARLLARHMTPALGQPVLVENLPGAGSNIGYEAVIRARPDGQTLGAGSDSLSINRALFPRLPFDPVADVAPVAQATRVPQIFVVDSRSPAQTLADFVGLSRRAQLAVGTPGNGSLSHLLQQVIQDATETRWTHVPYRGGALAINDLLGGSLHGVMINIGAVTEHIRAGRLRGLAVSSETRAATLPEVPSFAEAGLRNAAAVGWHGLFGPRGMAPETVARLHGAVVASLRHPDVVQRLAALGIEPAEDPPEALAARLATDAERWGALVRRIGLTPE